jgi:hypothetical protein
MRSPTRRRLRVGDRGAGGVGVAATKVGTHPHDATSAGADVFVADEQSDQVSVIRDAHLVAADVDPRTGAVFVAGRGAGRLERISLRGRRR